MRGRVYRSCALLCALLLASACGAPEPGPHVVLITVDTLRADRLGIYGYPRETSPRIDGFFAGGSVFEKASSSAPCTIPSVSQYLAGAYDYDDERPVLAEILAAAGWTTAAFVSQHNFHQALAVYQRGFEHFDIQSPEETNWNGATTRTANEVTDRALAWLEDHRDDERLFLWVHYFDPHDPYLPPEDFHAFHAETASEWDGDVARHRKQSGARDAELFSDDDVAHFRNLYDGEVAFTDAEIGRLLDGLEASGIADRSVVALTADHGESLWERDRWGHCNGLHDEVVRVPLLLRVNGGPVGAHSRVATPTSTLDLLPTLAGLFDLTIAPDAYHGVDLATLSPDRVVAAMWSREISIRDDDWKLVLEKGVPRALYWMEKDHEERWNRLADRPEEGDRLTQAAAPFVKLHHDLHLERIEGMLRKIGYIE